MGRLSAYGLEADALDVGWDMYPSTFTIYRMTRTYNDHGYAPMTWGVIGTTVGRVHELNAHERLMNDSRKDKFTHKCYCPPRVNITRNDVVIVTPDLPGAVNTFLVIHAHLPGNIPHHMEIQAKTIAQDSIEWAGYIVEGT